MRLADLILVDGETARGALTERDERARRGIAVCLLGRHTFVIDMVPEIVAMIDPVQPPECAGAHHKEQDSSGDEATRRIDHSPWRKSRTALV